MKPFNLELAKQGHPVMTRDGKPVRILCFDKQGTSYPLVGLVKNRQCEEMETYDTDGFSGCGGDSNLVMAPVKKSGWIDMKECIVYSSQQALRSKFDLDDCIPVYVEWEEK